MLLSELVQIVFGLIRSFTIDVIALLHILRDTSSGTKVENKCYWVGANLDDLCK